MKAWPWLAIAVLTLSAKTSLGTEIDRLLFIAPGTDCPTSNCPPMQAALLTTDGELYVYYRALPEPWRLSYVAEISGDFVDVESSGTGFLGLKANGEIWSWDTEHPPTQPYFDLPDDEVWKAIAVAEPGAIVSSEDGDVWWVCLPNCSAPETVYLGNPLTDTSALAAQSWGKLKSHFR